MLGWTRFDPRLKHLCVYIYHFCWIKKNIANLNVASRIASPLKSGSAPSPSIRTSTSYTSPSGSFLTISATENLSNTSTTRSKNHLRSQRVPWISLANSGGTQGNEFFFEFCRRDSGHPLASWMVFCPGSWHVGTIFRCQYSREAPWGGRGRWRCHCWWRRCERNKPWFRGWGEAVLEGKGLVEGEAYGEISGGVGVAVFVVEGLGLLVVESFLVEHFFFKFYHFNNCP